MSQRGKKSDRAKKEIEEGTARRKIPTQWGSETKKVKVAPNNLSDRDLK